MRVHVMCTRFAVCWFSKAIYIHMCCMTFFVALHSILPGSIGFEKRIPDANISMARRIAQAADKIAHPVLEHAQHCSDSNYSTSMIVPYDRAQSREVSLCSCVSVCARCQSFGIVLAAASILLLSERVRILEFSARKSVIWRKCVPMALHVRIVILGTRFAYFGQSCD